MIKNTTTKLIISVLVLSLAAVPVMAAKNSIDPAFNPSLLISDASFTDVGTFGTAEGIQKFLELKGSVLANTSTDFLAKLKEPDTDTKVALEDPEPKLTRLRTAAELVYDAATSHGLNPQVILVMLQKEQSLITGSFSSPQALQTALDHAVGFACPDSQPCGEIFKSFYRQLFGSFDADGNRWLGAAASLMRSYTTEINGVQVGRGPMVDSSGETFGSPTVKVSRKGDSIILDNTLGGYEDVAPQQSVVLSNFATAALYRYTPHVFNGNYNFWKFFSAWFKYANGTVIKRLKDDVPYVIDNGTKRSFSPFVAAQRKLDVNNVITVSQNEFDSYPTEKPLTPLEGTLIKGDADAAIYLIQDNSKHPISYPIFVQRKYSFAKVVTAPQDEVNSYDLGAFVAPLDGTLVIGQTSGTVYMIEASQKRAISAAIFKQRKLSFGKILKLSDAEIASIPDGPYLTPLEKTALKAANDPTIYWFRDNLKHPVSAFVYKQRGVGTFPLLVLSDAEMASLPSGPPLPPSDGTVFKGDTSAAIYIMKNGLKSLLSATAYKRLHFPKAIVLPQAEVDGYNPGDDILN